MTTLGSQARRLLTLLAAMLGAGMCVAAGGGVAAATTDATVNGQGSTYAALAFQQWTQAAQQQGLNVNYTATGSPAGLQAYEENTADFAGTEAEYSELYADQAGTANSRVPRGFAYTPDVAGAIAIVYHVALNPGGTDPVTYLQLSRLTVARIFLGVITNWDSPTISADNKGLVLPNKPIVIDYRTGQSGTTALFYDFVAKTDPSQFLPWAQSNSFPTSARVWEIDDGTGNFPPPNSQGFSGSTQQAQAVSSPGGMWSIGYDEFGYAKVYDDNVAWIENASGAWVEPYALNISAALQSAVLAPDTSQTLVGVYTSTNPLAYPISAYSYVLYQCAPTSARPTCKTPYSSPGIENTMAKFMRYIACTGQVKMATIGYSPLPTQLSQFLANAIGYMTGQTPPTLTPSNCANPEFHGGGLPAPPKDPVATVPSLGNGPGGGTSGSSAGKSGSGGTAHVTQSSGTSKPGSPGPGGPGPKPPTTSTTTPSVTSVVGLANHSPRAAGGGSAVWIAPAPVAYLGPEPTSTPPWPMVALLVLLFVPATLISVARRRRRTGGAQGGGGPPTPPIGEGRGTSGAS